MINFERNLKTYNVYSPDYSSSEMEDKNKLAIFMVGASVALSAYVLSNGKVHTPVTSYYRIIPTKNVVSRFPPIQSIFSHVFFPVHGPYSNQFWKISSIKDKNGPLDISKSYPELGPFIKHTITYERKQSDINKKLSLKNLTISGSEVIKNPSAKNGL